MLIAHRHLRLAVIFMLSVLPCFAHAAEVEFFSPSGEVKKVHRLRCASRSRWWRSEIHARLILLI